FFTIIMVIMLWLAQRLQDPVVPQPGPSSRAPAPGRPWPAFVAAAVASVMLAGIFPGLNVLSHHSASAAPLIELPQAVGQWHSANQNGTMTATAAGQATYLADGHRVDVRISSRPSASALILDTDAGSATDGIVVSAGWRSAHIDGTTVAVRELEYAEGT